MMNCLSTRSTLLATPSLHDAAVSAHLTDCPSCRAFAAALSQDEVLLRDAVNIAVPELLQERILLQTRLTQRQSSLPTRLRTWCQKTVLHRPDLALAFSAVLALGIVVALPSTDDNLNWGEVALAHVIAEPSALTGTASLSRDALATALAPYGLALRSQLGSQLGNQLGSILLVEHCAVPGGRGTHIVLETRSIGKITLLLPPSGKHVTKGEARAEGFSAQVVVIEGVSFGVVTDQPYKLSVAAALLGAHIVQHG